ncbi:type II toxin-antitoxin system death-on-curing family toxin [Methylocapsa sp. D3K7]|uniref:type II toxin-antitoxin system death-on-curing family toxin n=1 Tax=Methylocapsa sp. D3K7 TaxID=3041435 RepID=UPI00244ED2E4|nr:type II toxin-antitoxin system death-on-curing family toxin [Methylocapsa sp. D3K7]WGJ15940.1 type II toxin-antitoxin system death-on-curing family toxin [Methylocapsa sp. D3K7]
MIWIGLAAALAIHDEQIAEHGGASGVRDDGLLRSALDRPQNIAAYEEDADIARLAAAYGHGIVKNHPFIDGNKRTALVVTETFLNLNGAALLADDATCVAVIEALAGGTMKEDKFACWIRDNTA